MQPVCIFWFRRDLRLHDNAGLFHALKSGLAVVPVFVFDTHILGQLEDPFDKRVTFIHQSVTNLNEQLAAIGSSLITFYGTPLDAFRQLQQQFRVQHVYTNHDYEDYPIQRDASVREMLQSSQTSFTSCKDHVIFEKNEVVKASGEPYTVFTPYKNAWLKKASETTIDSYPVSNMAGRFLPMAKLPVPSLEQMGFKDARVTFPPKDFPASIISHYNSTRDYPAIEGTSRLGIHLRFGTISIRELVKFAMKTNSVYLDELIWREFYQAILYHFPHVGKGLAFKAAYDNIPWRNNETEFARWCAGVTGYPIVDAGMRQLNATGFMHNRVRMITASFLTKHLLIDWRWGESYFAQKLLDYEFASNNGGWQWAAGSGCDAAPYFRVFNPTLQAEKFDKDRHYVKHWVPELDTPGYPAPMVDHAFARKRALEVYVKALSRR